MFLLKRKIHEHETHKRLNYIFFLFFCLSNKLSYVRIIICILYNIQC